MNTITVTVSPTAVNDLLSIKQTLQYSAKDYSSRTALRKALDKVTSSIQHVVWSIMQIEAGTDTLVGWHANALSAITEATVVNTNMVVAEELLVAYRILTESVTIVAMTEAAK